jgi:HSP20 family molecular chaperone IbpA
MATPKRAISAESLIATAPRLVKEREADALDRAIRERIANRAYQLYEECGYQAGRHQDHWLQAESEVLHYGLEVRESGSWVAVKGSLPEVPAGDVDIYVDARRIVIRAGQRQGAPAPEAPGFETFLVAELNMEVEPATASAALKDGRLTLMVKKRFPSPVQPIEFASEH